MDILNEVGPFLCEEEPRFAEALEWFPDMPRPWGALGWKNHLFEFAVLWNGSLAMPVPGRRQKTDGLARLGVLVCRTAGFEPATDGPNSENFLRVRMRCAAGEKVEMVVPYMPVDPAVLEREMGLGWDGALEKARRFWKRELGRGAAIRVPDELATRSFAAVPWQSFVAAEKDPRTGELAFNTGAMHYEGIWATPFAGMNGWGLDYLGFHREAGEYLELFRRHQGEVAPPSDFLVPHDGFLTTPRRFETIKWISDHGAILFGSALHALLTADPEFIERWLPVWEKGLDWIRAQRRAAKRPFVPGLLPPGQATDDYQHFQFIWNDGWAYYGMKMVIELYRRLGRKETARWEKEAAEYRDCFLRAARRAARRAGTFTTVDGETHPFVPTNLNEPLASANDEAFYLDTGPLFAIFAGLIPAADPLADAVLAYFRKGPNLVGFRRESSPWQPPVLVHEISSCEPCYSWNIPVSLMRGERVRFAEGLFSLLAGAQSRRNLWDVETRNGVFGCCGVKSMAIHHLRHAIVEERDGYLELLRMPPRDWLRGRGIEFENVATWYGKMSMRTWMEGDTLHLQATLPKRDPVGRIVVHVPDLGTPEVVAVDGEEVDCRNQRVAVDPPASGWLRVAIRYRSG